MRASDLAEFIEQNEIAAEIVVLAQETPTVEAAAEAVGVSPDQIVKSVLFMVKKGEQELRPLLVIANGMLGVSRRRLRMARAAEVESVTGYPVGTVPPFGHKEKLPTLLDRAVLRQEEIFGGGGAISALMRLSTEELQRVLDRRDRELIGRIQAIWVRDPESFPQS